MELSGSQITSRTQFRYITKKYTNESTILRMKTNQHTNWQETVEHLKSGMQKEI